MFDNEFKANIGPVTKARVFLEIRNEFGQM